MKAHGRYECGDNFFKLDMHCNASMGIPINSSNVARLVAHYLETPSALPLPFVVAMKMGAEPLHADNGHLQCVSAIELRMAVLHAVARDVQAGDEQTLQRWRCVLLSTRFVYMALDSNEEVWKQARQFREDVSQNHVALRLSPLQAIYEVVHFRRRYERQHGEQSSKALAEAYRGGIRFAETSEEAA